jgi:cysteine synthase A
LIMILNNIIELIGNTPIIRLNKIEALHNLGCSLYAKLESQNPLRSVKDRVALSMIEEAERNGLINGLVIEPTSGNTGIGLAYVCAIKGYRLIIVMPDSMSAERIKLMRVLGAEVVLTPGSLGMKGAIDHANALAKENPGSYIPQQFDNPANVLAHYEGTGREILTDFNAIGEKVDIFVAGVGTGGTITGVGKALRERNDDVKIIAIEPKESAVLSGGTVGAHGLQGIGAGFVPSILDISLIDEIITVGKDEAITCSRDLAQHEGILCGFSGGAALYGAVEMAKKNRDMNIVFVLPDTGERYFSTDLY